MHPDSRARSTEPRARCPRRPRRPGWRGRRAATSPAPKAAAVQQHDPVVLGQAEGQIERMDILLQVLDSFLADVLRAQNSKSIRP